MRVKRFNKLYLYEEYIIHEETLNHWAYEFQWYYKSKQWTKIRNMKGMKLDGTNI